MDALRTEPSNTSGLGRRRCRGHCGTHGSPVMLRCRLPVYSHLSGAPHLPEPMRGDNLVRYVRNAVQRAF
jgi:hypothetical protein